MQMFFTHFFAAAFNQGAFADVLQFPHVARKIVVFEQPERVGTKGRVYDAHLAGEQPQEMLRQKPDVFPALAQAGAAKPAAPNRRAA